jgi:hypothetical protein
MQRLNDVVRLDDHLGHYRMAITCTHCKHSRRSDPHVFARLLGWNARLDALAERLRCSNCGRKGATIVCEVEPRPRGLPKNPH